MALLTLRRDEFSDLRTVAQVTVRRPTGTQRFTGVLLAKPPASLRFEALSPFGQPFVLLAIADGTLTSYSVADNLALRGPVTARTSARWLGVPLEADGIVGLLIGRLSPPRALRQAEVLEADADGPSLKLVGEDHSLRVWMDWQTGEIAKAEIGGGRTRLVVTYTRSPDGDLPGEIHATAGEANFDATVRYLNPAVGTGVEPERFRLAPPEGARIQYLH